jgi:Uma2 family endonuclease
MGEAEVHFETTAILRYGLKAHLAGRPGHRVFSDLNFYYHPKVAEAYVSPDNMVVIPSCDLGDEVPSYRLHRDGPAPLLTAEVLSRRSWQQRDLGEKLVVYAGLGVAEYILVDVTGKYLGQRLLLKRLGGGHAWHDEQDADGGVTSVLGFRLVIAADGKLRVLNAQTGEPYPRPDEADVQVRQAEKQARQAEKQARQAEKQAQLAEIRSREAEEQARDAEVRTRQAEDRAQQAERNYQKEVEARRLAEERLQALQAELAKRGQSRGAEDS